MYEGNCPKCGNEIELKDWEDYNCPICEHEGWWEEEFIEEFTEDYSNSWNIFYWYDI